MAFEYRVRCTFTDPAVATRWLEWLQLTHLDDVKAAGARSARVLRIDSDDHVLEAVYTFADRAAFTTYERDHAPRLRDEGLALFPLAFGLTYERTTAVSL